MLKYPLILLTLTMFFFSTLQVNCQLQKPNSILIYADGISAKGFPAYESPTGSPPHNKYNPNTTNENHRAKTPMLNKLAGVRAVGKTQMKNLEINQFRFDVVVATPGRDMISRRYSYSDFSLKEKPGGTKKEWISMSNGEKVKGKIYGYYEIY